MNNKTSIIAGLLLTLSTALAGCGGSYNAPPPAQPPTAPPAPQPVVYSQFVKDQFAATADDTDPVEVDATEFSFADQDDPDAFDDLLTPP